MRDILEDAQKHIQDGYGRAQAHEKRVLPKRFYKNVEIKQIENGFTILLDGRGVKTPSKKDLIVPNNALAKELAIEWQAQEREIDASKMPSTRLVNSALEGDENIEEALRDEIIKYASSDLLLYRANSPNGLVQAQEQHWDSALNVLAQKFAVKFLPTIGIVHQEQPEKTLECLKISLEKEDSFILSALMLITSLTGSGLLAIAIFNELINADAAWSAAHVDEDYSNRVWGEDSEAMLRRTKRRIDFDSAVRLLALLGADAV